MLKLNSFILLMSTALGLFFPQSVLADVGTGDIVEEKKNHSTSSETLKNISSPEQPKFFDNYKTNHNSYGASSNTTLTPPDCAGSCFYAIGRFKHSLDGSNTTEILIGGQFDFNSPNKTTSSAYANSMKVRDAGIIQDNYLAFEKEISAAIDRCVIHRVQLLSRKAEQLMHITREEISSIVERKCKVTI